MNEPKISIIIPVYKAEPYLGKCLDSVVGQTYRNLEIILVDDGSPDGCGIICDEYAKQDGRITVIHQNNGGVSSARNAGLRRVTGSYIGWVDSDDWIEPDMYEYLLKNIIDHDADIAVCGRCERYREKTVNRCWQKTEVLDTESALRLLLENGQMQNFLWDKLWRRELFRNIYFPEGKTYEDIAIMHRLFERAEKIVCLNETKYHYVQHPGSIVADTSLENRLNHYKAAKARFEEMKETWPQFKTMLLAQCVASAVGIWVGYLSNPWEERQKYVSEIEEIANFSALHYREALAQIELGKAGRIVLRLTPYNKWWSFALAYCVGKLYQWKHGRAL